jgi:luciferase family oxidoreductase group 1
MTPALSVLDLVPVREDQSTSDALAASRDLARTADGLGLRRYWVAEHHNMPSVAATNPAVLISMLAAATDRIRVGSGGVMLPNHAPLVVAEQFALLEAAHPGRIDLGIGRAPGSDPVTSWALRTGSGIGPDAVNDFPDHVRNVLAMMSPDGVVLDLRGREYALRATPQARTRPPVWLLGSSDYSARLAAQEGLPYVFAHHFSGQGTLEALELYRSSFRPSAHLDAPRTFLTVNAVVAESSVEARRRALPNQLMMLALRTGQPLGPQLLVEEAEKVELSPQQGEVLERMAQRWIVGDPAEAGEQLERLVATYEVDEVMVHPVAGAHVGTEPGTAPAREETLRLLADWVSTAARG